MKFKAEIHVMLKQDVADVQGAAIQQSLVRHDHPVESVKAGKFFEVVVEAENEEAARKEIETLGDGTFSNPTIEIFRYDLQAL